MRIGELAKDTGLSASAIRYYESKGLLNIGKRSANGYREYPPEATVVLQIISCAQQAGFSLEEIANIIPENFTDWKHDELIAALRSKIADIDRMQKHLTQTRAHLEGLIVQIESKPSDMACAENAQRVMKAFQKKVN